MAIVTGVGDGVVTVAGHAFIQTFPPPSKTGLVSIDVSALYAVEITSSSLTEVSIDLGSTGIDIALEIQ